MIISAIVAIDLHNGIGKDGKLLFRLPSDMRWFRRNTLGKPVIMGRKTFESLGKFLDQRRNIVVSRNPLFVAEGCEVVTSAMDALIRVLNFPEAMIIGGESIYREFLPAIKKLYLTLVYAELEADAFFPRIDFTKWRSTFFSGTLPADGKNKYEHSFNIFEKKHGS